MHEGNVLLEVICPSTLAFFLVTRSAYSRTVVRTSRKLSKSAWTKASGTRPAFLSVFEGARSSCSRRHLLAHSQRGAPYCGRLFAPGTVGRGPSSKNARPASRTTCREGLPWYRSTSFFHRRCFFDGFGRHLRFAKYFEGLPVLVGKRHTAILRIVFVLQRRKKYSKKRTSRVPDNVQ